MGSKYACDLRWIGLRPSQLPGLNLPNEVVGNLAFIAFVLLPWQEFITNVLVKLCDVCARSFKLQELSPRDMVRLDSLEALCNSTGDATSEFNAYR
jgi:hypothetical protein